MTWAYERAAGTSGDVDVGCQRQHLCCPVLSASNAAAAVWHMARRCGVRAGRAVSGVRGHTDVAVLYNTSNSSLPPADAEWIAHASQQEQTSRNIHNEGTYEIIL